MNDNETFFSESNSSSKIKRIEPAFWWSGFKNPELELLVYGENINCLNLQFSGDIPIKEVKKIDNPNYLFVNIDTRDVDPGEYELVFKNGEGTIHKCDYEFKKREENSAQRPSFDSSDAIYLLMPDRFSNGNPDIDSEDSVSEKSNRSDPDGRHGGDIEGIIQHLDYLEDLGVTTIWSTPLLEDNEPKTSYHGYAQNDYYRIDPRYGTNEDYKRLAKELHNRGMKLIMDYVANHWGSQHWILQDLPSDDWVHYWKNQEGGFKRSNYQLTTQLDPNSAKVDAKETADGWFDVTMPDMNQKNPLFLNYMVQNAIWWIEYAGLDGLRVDTYPYNDKHGIAEWTRRIREEYPNLNIVGEIWMHNQAHIAYWQKDSKIGELGGYNSHLPSVMDFTLHDAVVAGFHEQTQEWNSGMMRFYDNFANDFLYPDTNNIMVFMENHDTERFNQMYTEFSDYILAMTLISTIRGIPQYYYGTEIGMKGDKGKGDGDIRRDFPGGWEGDENNAFLEEGRSELQHQYFNFTRKLLNWRKQKGVIHTGKTLHYIPEDNTYVYFRYNKKDTVMVVLNNKVEEKILDLNRFTEGIKDFSKGYDVLYENEFDLKSKLSIGAKSALILELY